ncbi:MAG: endolytic transglycosylase MltG [Candidatus Kerfeldbacteria bacterium]|nr:endolytic transglycosylase MltG [Candidatus Kerfeldbacteria bacterium]
MMKKLFIIVVVLIFVGGALGTLYYWNQISWPVSDDTSTKLYAVREGEGVKEIAQGLFEAGLIKSTFWFETYVFFDGSESQFIAGTYSLSPSLNSREVVDVLTSGETTPEANITMIEGWTAEDMGAYLEERGVVRKDEFLQAALVTDSRDIISDVTYGFLADKPDNQGLEGFLFPDTYRIYDGATSADVIKKMLDNFDVKLSDELRSAAAARGMSIYEIVTLASIIEKEVRSDDDRAIASGIFYARLEQGVALQSDATVNYVTGKQALQPTLEDLETDNPYNTYKHQGLPPGPICNPSLSALRAAVYPAETEYFYFLTKPDGSTVFSVTYDEHLENKAKYLQ